VGGGGQQAFGSHRVRASRVVGEVKAPAPPRRQVMGQRRFSGDVRHRGGRSDDGDASREGGHRTVVFEPARRRAKTGASRQWVCVLVCAPFWELAACGLWILYRLIA